MKRLQVVCTVIHTQVAVGRSTAALFRDSGAVRPESIGFLTNKLVIVGCNEHCRQSFTCLVSELQCVQTQLVNVLPKVSSKTFVLIVVILSLVIPKEDS